MADVGGVGPSSTAVAAAVNAAGDEEQRWRRFDSSVNALSFGFVATAILISMFLIMAIFERFLRPTNFHNSPPLPTTFNSSRGRRNRRSSSLSPKLSDYPSPKMSVYSKGVSVLMPGHSVPTFIAHPAPAPCPHERISWPSHHPIPFNSSLSNSDDLPAQRLG